MPLSARILISGVSAGKGLAAIASSLVIAAPLAGASVHGKGQTLACPSGSGGECEAAATG